MLSRAAAAKVDNVVHRAKVAVDESGAEASGASLVFAADRPFVFLIRHRPTNMALFVGRVSRL